MDQPQTPQSRNSSPIPREIGDRYPSLVSNHDHFNRPSPSDEDADLTTDFIRKFYQKACDFRSDDLLGRDLPPVDISDPSDLIGL
ncbi:MAG: hypothetical protein Q7U55_10530 [Deltaproteobacteria bacterium]|nr:hypothetical protein [Deltaproteobacteria bacterium]